MAGLWIAAVVVVALQASAHHVNNFETFRTSWFNLVGGRGLYGANPAHQDYFKYSPTFALLFAPFAVVPFTAGVLLWSAVNAGALYWALGRVLAPREALAARAIVFLDTIGSMQNVQSNALSAGLVILAFSDLSRRRELRAALAIATGTLIKVYPIIAGAFAVFRPYRIPRLAGWGVVVAAGFIAAPLLVVSPAELARHYRDWAAISRADAMTRGYSVMEQIHLWTGTDWPNWPVQLAGVGVLLAPLARLARWGIAAFRLLFLASVLMFCILFNHKAESPGFVVAVAGVAIWFLAMPRDRLRWTLLGIVVVGTILSASDAMPEPLQEGYFEPYRLKTLPVLLVWLLTQYELWTEGRSRRSGSAPRPAHRSSPAAAAT